MEQITIDLQPQAATPARRIIQRTLFGLMGVFSLVQGILQNNSFRYLNIVVGVGIIVFALYYRRIYKPKVFTFDENCIEGPIGSSENKRINWSDVSKLDAKIFTLKIFMKSGEESKIYLGNITFQELKQIKPRILEFAKSKGVEVRAA
jgi:hypothetical protein